MSKIKSRWVNGLPRSVHKSIAKKTARLNRSVSGVNKPLSEGFINQMFKVSERTPLNVGRMNSKDLRAEFTKQSKVANRRINEIRKSGYYSHSLNQLELNGFKGKFGIKNQGLTSDTEIRTAYKELMGFLNSHTSSKSGIRDVIDTTNHNFNLSFDGDYVKTSHRNKQIFKIYDDLINLSQNGLLPTHNKYEIVSSVGELWDTGQINEASDINEVVRLLGDKIAQLNAKLNNLYQTKLHFNWMV